MKIKTLYEDKDILVIEKPFGISVHQDLKKEKETISDYFIKKYPKSKNVGESIFKEGKEIKKPGIVHRLDKETSGVLILAKNKKSYEFLKNQFKEREIKKIYNCLVSGHFKNDRGIINKPIGRSPVDFRRRLAGRGVRGELKEAITQYRVLKRFKDEKGNKFTYLEVRPKTGRTHQIRVHMKYLNHPIVGDSLYDPKGINLNGIKRMMLHASSIQFKNLKGEIIKIESKLPKEFKTTLNY